MVKPTETFRNIHPLKLLKSLLCKCRDAMFITNIGCNDDSLASHCADRLPCLFQLRYSTSGKDELRALTRICQGNLAPTASNDRDFFLN
jgi:hypothetical protein